MTTSEMASRCRSCATSFSAARTPPRSSSTRRAISATRPSNGCIACSRRCRSMTRAFLCPCQYPASGGGSHGPTTRFFGCLNACVSSRARGRSRAPSSGRPLRRATARMPAPMATSPACPWTPTISRHARRGPTTEMLSRVTGNQVCGRCGIGRSSALGKRTPALRRVGRGWSLTSCARNPAHSPSRWRRSSLPTWQWGAGARRLGGLGGHAPRCLWQETSKSTRQTERLAVRMVTSYRCSPVPTCRGMCSL